MTILEYANDMIAELHASGYFTENRISDEEMREIIVTKCTELAVQREGYFGLDADQIEEVLIRGVEMGVDNSFAKLTELGLIQTHVNENGNLAFSATEQGKRHVDQYGIIPIIQKHGKA